MSKQEYGEYLNRPIRESEQFWVSHAQWLEQMGYRLRPRYQPGWVPKFQSIKDFSKNPDNIPNSWPAVLDATRISDNSPVMLKKISRSRHPHEVEIGLYFSRADLAANPRNHCIPILDVLSVSDDSDLDLIVMPVLRKIRHPRFDTVGEVVDFIRQVLEGVQFMHQHRVAHCDCMDLNILMDGSAMFPEGWHPMSERHHRDDTTRYAKPVGSRTRFWPKYYLVDFGLSQILDPKGGPPLRRIILGGDKTPPEHGKAFARANPFPTDVYFIGNLIRETFLQSKDPTTRVRLGFLKPLVDDMVHEDTVKRPTIDEVVLRFDDLWRSQPRRVFSAAPDTWSYEIVYADPFHNVLTRWSNFLTNRPALPQIEKPRARLPSGLRWFYSSPPLKYPDDGC
ncbi:hypothetical protein VKT23_017747 [Stygiomarasmius scandens]|uniref:Protein kinase domain-containing protein n=1 Tax=Marasmiellus scandens TaxID=2682957 RepID=A0ABR1IR82_9AGAR